MEIEGESLPGVEVGNAWEVDTGPQKNGWFVGYSEVLMATPLRYMPQKARASEVCVKWYEHEPGDPKGKHKPPTTGRTLTILVNEGGRFRLTFRDGQGRTLRATLTRPGDFAAYGSGLQHEWEVEAPSTMLTVHWIPVEGGGGNEDGLIP